MTDGCLIVGAGDGTIDILDEINWKGEFPQSKVLDPNMPHFRAVSLLMYFCKFKTIKSYLLCIELYVL